MPSPETVSAAEFKKALESDSGCIVLDVRTDIEHAALCCAGENVLHVPMDRIDPAALGDRIGSRPVYVLCQSGARAAQVAQTLCSAAGNSCGPVRIVAGGLAACESAGVPILRNAKVVSLERQVRIAAGALVLAGAILGWTVAPGFYLLSAAVGGGLIFSGVTGYCGMALLLAKAPWNAIGPEPQKTEKKACSAGKGCGCG